MRHAKTAFAIYVGIYLILPGCLCQVLSAFGIEDPFHGSKSAEELRVVSDGSLKQAPVCHCDDEYTKSAEFTPTETEADSSPPPLVALTSHATLPNAASSSTSQLGSRAPPGVPAWTLAVFSGVYLL